MADLPKFDELKPVPERPAFSGFLPRLGAFLIDCVLLYFLFKGLESAARPALLRLNPWLPWLGNLIVFLYFWMGYGPLTKGQTLGKALLGITVMRRDGAPISWAAAARRALLQHGVFLIFVGLDRPSYEFIFPARASYAAGIATSMIMVAALVYLASLTLTVAFHPWKRGWHDLWAGSFVTASPPPPAFRATLDLEPDDLTVRRMKTFTRMSLIFWAVATIVLLASSVRYFANADQRRLDARAEVLKQDFAFGNLRLVDLAYPDMFTRDQAMQVIGQRRAQLRARGETVPTTETLLNQVETMVASVAVTRGGFAPEELKSPAFREGMEKLRRAAWGEWQARAGNRVTSSTAATTSTATASAAASATLQARNFAAFVFEPLSLVMYNKVLPRGWVHGPADPSQGGLSFDNVPSSTPQAADQPTTTSATPAPVRTPTTPGS